VEKTANELQLLYYAPKIGRIPFRQSNRRNQQGNFRKKTKIEDYKFCKKQPLKREKKMKEDMHYGRNYLTGK